MTRSWGQYSFAYFITALRVMTVLVLSVWGLYILTGGLIGILFITGAAVVFLVVPVFVPPWRIATRFWHNEERFMTRKEGWLFAAACALLGFAALVVLVGVFALFGVPLAVDLIDMAGDDLTLMLSGLAVYGAVWAVMIRATFWVAERFAKAPA